MSSTKKGSVTVSLAGHKFSIKSDHPETHLHSLAAYVDKKVRELQRMSRTVGTHQLALLAAMNIADELFASEQRSKEFKSRVVRKSETLLRSVEHALQSRAAAAGQAAAGNTGRAKEAKS